jgi:hypothetical protein
MSVRSSETARALGQRSAAAAPGLRVLNRFRVTSLFLEWVSELGFSAYQECWRVLDLPELRSTKNFRTSLPGEEPGLEQHHHEGKISNQFTQSDKHNEPGGVDTAA